MNEALFLSRLQFGWVISFHILFPAGGLRKSNGVPPSMTLWDAASPVQSQGFVPVGALIMLPAVLAYSGYSYHVFRGKVTAETTYY